MTRNDYRKPRGSIYNNNGYWYIDVRLPGETKRHKHPLCAPGSDTAMRADRPRDMAIEAAHRLWENATRQQRTAPAGSSVADICAKYLAHAAVYYHGSKEVATVTCALRVFKELHGSRPIGELVHADLLRVRDAMVRHGMARTSINKYICIISNRMLPWACDEGLIRPAVRVELSGVQPLKRGRTEAKETAPVRAVDDATIAATVQHMMPNTADMVRVHRLTGMRPEELCAMRWQDIDQSCTPWVYRPQHHKNEWRGQPRVVVIGPRARAILDQHRATEYPFSPVAAVYERMQQLRAAAVSPAPRSRADPHAQVRPRDHWDTSAYSKTIAAACRRAGIPSWSANQLRHAFATQLRRTHGIEAARAALGHASGCRITDRYSFEAAADEAVRAASPAVEAIG